MVVGAVGTIGVSSKVVAVVVVGVVGNIGVDVGGVVIPEPKPREWIMEQKITSKSYGTTGIRSLDGLLFVILKTDTGAWPLHLRLFQAYRIY